MRTMYASTSSRLGRPVFAFWAKRAPTDAPRDARPWQIAVLLSLIGAGVFALSFDLPAWHPPVTLAAALATQWAACRVLKLPFDPLSPAITALSLTLLLRTDAAWISALAAFAAIGSKFALRWRGRHLFNPANIALVLLTLTLPGAWISPGQWGSAGLLAVVIAGAGTAVAGRAARLDTTSSFLAAWAALAFGRAVWMGDPWAIPLHQMQSGALLVFAFFMISDPATTPRARWGRVAHAAAVAGLGFALQTLWLTNAGPILALALLAPLVPLLDWGAAQLSRPQPETALCPASPPSHG